MAKQIVVIGNGIAALSAVEKIRQYDQSATVTVFAQEPFATYNRLELSKRITQNYSPDRILLKTADWYEQANIDLQLKNPVVALNIAEKTVTTAKGEKFGFTHLLAANGASNGVPPIEGIDLKNVFSLRTLDDAIAIRESLANARRVLLIGGGLLGLELAWQLRQMDLAVTIVEVFSQLMPRQLDLESSRYLEDVVRSHGVELVLASQVSKLVGDTKITGYQLKEDQSVYPVDLCLYSTGIRPNTALYRGSNLNIDKGIVVDSQMRTNIENVYAAGDVAEFDGKVFGLWSVARAQGAVAGANLVRDEARVEFEAVYPVTNVNVFNQVITSLGEVQLEEKLSFMETREGQAIFRKLFFRGNLLKGAVFINDHREVLLVKKALGRNAVIPPQQRSSFLSALEFLREQ